VYIFAAVVRSSAVLFRGIGCRVPNMLTGSVCWEVGCFTAIAGDFDSIRRLTNPGFKVALHRSMSRLLKAEFSGMFAPSTLNVKFVQRQWLAFFPRRRSWWPRHLRLLVLRDLSLSAWEWSKAAELVKHVLSRHLYFLEVAVVPSGMV